MAQQDRQKIADKTHIVRDPNTGVTRQIIAGQPIPPDLVDAVEGPSVVEEGQEDEKAKAQKAAEAKPTKAADEK
jgi:hypothetical protein